LADARQTHYLNADFDLGLRPRARRLEDGVLGRQVRELSVQALLGCEPGDAALVRTEVDEPFLEHLSDCGVPVPLVLAHPRVDPSSRLRPFGWSAEAIELNSRHHRPAEHPALDVVRRVNSRSFALELEAELSPGHPGGTVVADPRELEAFLSHAATAGEWVVKSEHGNAGLGNRRVRAPRLAAADRGFVNGLFAEDDRLVVEPWLERQSDWCAVFEVPFDSSSFRVHATDCTRDGALVGAQFEPGGPANLPWPDEIGQAAERIASRLEREGYFGPASFDAFGWRDGDRVRLRPLADLNCRHAMSDGAFRLWRRLAPERCWYYRFFSRRRLPLPGDLPEALAALGDLRYDPDHRRGVLLASPTRFAKLAVVLVASDPTGIRALEHELRARFEP
jgi:hypothetical protein